MLRSTSGLRATNASTCLRVTYVTCCDAMNATMRWPSPFKAGVRWTRASPRSPTLVECFVARARSLWLHLQIRWSLMLSASYNDDAVNCEQDHVDVANAEPAETIFTSTCHVPRLRSGRLEGRRHGGVQTYEFLRVFVSPRLRRCEKRYRPRVARPMSSARSTPGLGRNF